MFVVFVLLHCRKRRPFLAEDYASGNKECYDWDINGELYLKSAYQNEQIIKIIRLKHTHRKGRCVAVELSSDDGHSELHIIINIQSIHRDNQ